MKIFISWSGDNSKRLGEALRNWLPAVLQLVKPYFTPSDIEKGTRWSSEIAKELEFSEVGILCVTRENLHSDWVMFEAGALSKSLDKAHVCPVLFGIHNTDLTGPLEQFQTTEFEKEDFRKLISVINATLGDNKLPATVLDSVFEKWWPELEAEVNKILGDLEESSSEPVRSERELLVEILGLSRSAERTARRPSPLRISPARIKGLLATYIAVHDENVAGQGGYQDTLDRLLEMKEPILWVAHQFSRSSPKTLELIERLEGLTFMHEKKEEEEEEAEEETEGERGT